LDGADKQQKPKPKQISPDQRQQNGLPKNGTPDKPAEKPSPFDEEPIPPKPPMSQATDQSQSRAASVRDGTASATTNRTSTAPQDTVPKALTIQQPDQRRTTDIAVRLSQSRASDSGTLTTLVQHAPLQSLQAGKGDSHNVLERGSSPVHEQQAAQNAAQPRPTPAPTANSTELASRNAPALASQNVQHRVVAASNGQLSGVAKAEAVPKVAIGAKTSQWPNAGSPAAAGPREQQTSTSSGVRNPNLPTLAERLRQQAAQAHSQSVSASQAVAAAQPASAPAQQVQQPAASASATKPGSGQLARTQPAATQLLAAPLPPPLRSLGESSPAARLPTDGKVAVAKPGLLLLGYRTGEE